MNGDERENFNEIYYIDSYNIVTNRVEKFKKNQCLKDFKVWVLCMWGGG